MDQIVMTDDGAALGDLTLDLYKHHVGGFAGAIGNFQVATWRRTDIAVQMFDSACRVFLAGGHESVVINLAGVAEELFDGELSRVGRKEERFIAELELRIYGDSPSQQERADLWNFVREARNAIKHWRDGKPTVSTEISSLLGIREGKQEPIQSLSQRQPEPTNREMDRYAISHNVSYVTR